MRKIRVWARGLYPLALFANAICLSAATPIPAAATLPEIKVLATDPTALEGATTAAFTVIRSGNTNDAVKVQFLLSGSASNGVDYVRLTNFVTIPASLWAANVVVQPIDNGQVEKDKTVVLTLESNASYTLGAARTATVTIVENRFNDIPTTVTLVSPTNGAVIAAHANVVLLATATDPDDAILKVMFFVDDHSIGSVTNPPYSLTWTNVTPGRHTLFAMAKDALDETALSATVKVTVSNAAPVVSLTSPTNGAVFRVPTNLVLTATATDSDDAIQKVSFYANGRFLHTVTNSPYSWTWTNVPPNRYQLVARATDVFGAATESASVRITVSNAPPVVALTSPTSGSAFHVPTNITLQATVSDSDDPIRTVAFYSNGHLLRSLTNSPYTWTWTNVPPGVHTLVARATDTYGATTESTSVRITISNAPPVVHWLTPTNNARLITPATVTLTATATDADDPITNVAFYANNHLLGRVTQPPYSLVWTNPAFGPYTLAAVAVDSYGATARALNYVLIDTNHPPSVRFVQPTDLTAFHTVTNLPVTVDASSDPLTFVKRVDVFLNGVQFASFTSASSQNEFKTSLNNLTPANYELTATVTDGLGLMTTSAPVHLVFATGLVTPEAEGTLVSLLNPSPLSLAPKYTVPADPDSETGAVQVGRTGPRSNLVERAYVEFSVPSAPGGLLAATLVVQHVGNPLPGSFYLSSYPADLVVDTNDFSDSTTPLTAFTTEAGTAVYNLSPIIMTLPGNGLPPFMNQPMSSANVSYTGQTLEFDVTALVRAYLGTNVGFQIRLPDELVLGASLESHTFTDFRLYLASPSNLPPVVRILNPTNNAAYPTSMNLVITAEARDFDGTMNSLDFFAGTNRLVSLAHLAHLWAFMPQTYGFVWTNAPAGSYDLTVRATDDQGASTTSAPVHITIGSVHPALAAASDFPANPILDTVTELADGGVLLTIRGGPAGGRIAVESSSNFADWTVLTVLANPSGTVHYIDSAATRASRRFYRVRPAE